MKHFFHKGLLDVIPAVRGERHSARSRAGSALVIVLGMLSVLLLMGVAFSVTMRTERAAAANKRHADMARHILESALVRVMSDLDVQLADEGDRPVPVHTVVAVSEPISADSESVPVNLLSHEVVRHLPPDQLAAALATNTYCAPRACWRPIYGDVRISTVEGTSGGDVTQNDSPVGRYAYLVLNNSGLLDPNVLVDSAKGNTNRLTGIGAGEIQLGDSGSNSGDGYKSSGNVFGDDGKLSDFGNCLESDGHYVTMRDFLRPSVTNALKMTSFDPANPTDLEYTNSFAIGGFALDDLTPPDSDGNRLPKLALTKKESGDRVVLKTPDDFTDTELDLMAEYFRRAFSLSANLHTEKIPAGTKLVPVSTVAARALLDALDTDFVPGSLEHTVSELNDEDEYLKALGTDGVKWHALPCTEPVALLDNALFIAGTDDQHPGLELSPNVHTNKTPEGVVSDVSTNGYKVSITLGIAQNSSCYSGWNIPKSVEGKTFYHHWFFTNPDARFDKKDESDSKYKTFCDAFRKKVSALSLNRAEGSMTVKMSRTGSLPVARGDFMPAQLVWKIEDIELPEAQTKEQALEHIPDFGIDFYIQGFLFERGSGSPKPESDTLIECVPTQRKNGGYGDDMQSGDGDSWLEAHVCFKKNILKKLVSQPSGDQFTLNASSQPHFVGAVFCLDPIFGYNHDSWITTASCGDTPAPIQEAIMWDGENTQDKPDGWLEETKILNPLSYVWLTSPRQCYANYDVLTVGGICDVMWAYEDDNDNDDLPEDAGRTFYLDPEDDDPDSPYAFTRPGQLGFLPIGTRRTIALFDGFDESKRPVPRQNVLDYFTMNPPRTEDEKEIGKENSKVPFKTAIRGVCVNLNPPRAVVVEGSAPVKSIDDGYNLRPMAAALNGCPLREWRQAQGGDFYVDWDTALEIAQSVGKAIDNRPSNEDYPSGGSDSVNWNHEKSAWGVSFLGRCPPDGKTIQEILKSGSNSHDARCDFDREGVIRNSSELFTTRQQLFTILLKADSFTPKVGYLDAEHGTSLASVHAIAHVWRDPEPMRNGAGELLEDSQGNPIHAWVLLDMYQF